MPLPQPISRVFFVRHLVSFTVRLIELILVCSTTKPESKKDRLYCSLSIGRVCRGADFEYCWYIKLVLSKNHREVLVGRYFTERGSVWLLQLADRCGCGSKARADTGMDPSVVEEAPEPRFNRRVLDRNFLCRNSQRSKLIEPTYLQATSTVTVLRNVLPHSQVTVSDPVASRDPMRSGQQHKGTSAQHL